MNTRAARERATVIAALEALESLPGDAPSVPEHERVFSEAREAFINGWIAWVRGDERPSQQDTWSRRAGWDLAAHTNDHGGGERPRASDASEACDDWIGMIDAQAGIYATAGFGGVS